MCSSPGCTAPTSSMRFEFLDNRCALGARRETVAFGDNYTLNVLDVRGMLDIERLRADGCRCRRAG